MSNALSPRYPGTLYGNADGLQPRTLEILQSYGLLEILRPKAAYMHAIVRFYVFLIECINQEDRWPMKKLKMAKV